MPTDVRHDVPSDVANLMDAVDVVDVPDSTQPHLLCVGDRAGTDFEQRLMALPADSWWQAPDSAMRSACVPDAVGVRGVGGCPAVVSAWSGGAYDSDQQRMIVWGGGHDDYWGNELYAFDLRQGHWARLTEPSTVPDGSDQNIFLNQDPLPDGQPVSRHTYSGIQYDTLRHRLIAHGGSRARDGSITRATWSYGDADGWQLAAEGPGGYSLASIFDARSGIFFVMAAERLHQYDAALDQWHAIDGFGFPPLWPRYAVSGDKSAALDTRRHLMWVVGSEQILVWDIDASEPRTDDWVTSGGGVFDNIERTQEYPAQRYQSGGGDVYNAEGPGIDYDVVNDAMVAWVGSGGPYVLDLPTRQWSQGSGVGAPVSTNAGGTFGRWRYLAETHVFVLINDIDENVYFYKHTAGCGAGASE